MYMDKFEDKPTLEQIKKEYGEMITGIFPALHKYKTEHNTDNLKNYVSKLQTFAVPYMRVRKMSKKDRYLMLCLTNLIKGDKIILPLMNIARVFIDFDLAKLTTLYRVVFLFQKKY